MQIVGVGEDAEDREMGEDDLLLCLLQKPKESQKRKKFSLLNVFHTYNPSNLFKIRKRAEALKTYQFSQKQSR